MTDDFFTKYPLARTTIINWLVNAGAELVESDDGEDEDSLGDELTTLMLDDVEFYVGPATCDSSFVEHWEIDQDAKVMVIDPNSHHHFEVAALPITDSPKSLELLADLVYPLKPPADNDQSFAPSGLDCEPFNLEVSDDDGSNNVWVVRRFRVDDITSEDFDSLMREVLNVAREVRNKVKS